MMESKHLSKDFSKKTNKNNMYLKWKKEQAFDRCMQRLASSSKQQLENKSLALSLKARALVQRVGWVWNPR